jgi:hypothetical protein
MQLSFDNDSTRPTARYKHGFTSAGGKLYVHGGTSYSSGACAREKGVEIIGEIVALAPTGGICRELSTPACTIPACMSESTNTLCLNGAHSSLSFIFRSAPRHFRRPALLRPRYHGLDAALSRRRQRPACRQIRARLRVSGGTAVRARGQRQIWWVHTY